MAGLGGLVNNLQNTQRKKPYSSSTSKPAKLKTATECMRKRPMMCGDLDSNPCSISNQKTDLGRSLSSRDLNFFISKVRIVLFALFIPHSTSHEEANTIPDGKAQ